METGAGLFGESVFDGFVPLLLNVPLHGGGGSSDQARGTTPDHFTGALGPDDIGSGKSPAGAFLFRLSSVNFLEHVPCPRSVAVVPFDGDRTEFRPCRNFPFDFLPAGKREAIDA